MISSVDKTEIEKFSKLADKWWEPKGEFKILHQINPIRIEYITSKIQDHFSSDSNKIVKIIDVGCGGGIASTALCRPGFDITGLDASEQNIEAAIIHAQLNQLKIKYLHKEIKELKERYDVVLCLEVIEHVANLEAFFSEITNILKPGGMIILSTINRNIKSYLLGIIAAEYILKWIPKNTHDYKRFLKPSELNNFIIPYGLTIKELKGLNFSPLNQSWNISNDISVNYFAYIA